MKNTYTSPELEISVIDLDVITSSAGVETPVKIWASEIGKAITDSNFSL